MNLDDRFTMRVLKMTQSLPICIPVKLDVPFAEVRNTVSFVATLPRFARIILIS